MTYKILDLFCGGGGAGMGYRRAGFDVVGIDINPMPRYPFTFYQANALSLLAFLNDGGYIPRNGLFLEDFAAIHASPPCQQYSVAMNAHPASKQNYPDLVEAVRLLLKEAGLPYVIENVVGAPLISPVTLCGTSFNLRTRGLEIRRHRLFETSFLVPELTCTHTGYALNPWNTKVGHAQIRKAFGESLADRGGKSLERIWADVMGLHWMKGRECREAIPPVFTEYIGRYLMEHLESGERTWQR